MTAATRVALAILVGVAAGGLTACASSASGVQASPGVTSAAHTEAASPAPSPDATMGDPAATTSSSAAPSTQALDLEVTARDLSFTPTELDIPAVGTTRIVLRNQGFAVHNLTVDALGIQAVAPRGGVAEVTLTDPPLGTYEFYCSVSGHREAGMVGTLVVSP
jgi:uncharacterized cupredoxin-like copper-binding protein